ncbi:MAG: lysylphosphatidylglycerol synthase transmembrane domain-containing protein [Candidatus Shapirobacteria bacterium]|nr:lysylphosphatidylglycerol synthase transmembrane domain-containing protein [Candidatus Shapirobacteria bacterium]MDD4410496.1 lysylphosphatidylglycerol synthase transmembrane domain-containing protein [Candidatus Shapirobacteria bacterium]
MLKILKKVFASKLFRLIFSAILVYFAFKKVNIIELFRDIKNVPFWFVLVNVVLSFWLVVLISARWNLLLFSKIKIRTVLTFTRANFLATFYSLFFSTAVVGEVAKWMVIDHKYPKIPKTKILGSVLLDRFIGFSVFIILGLIAGIVGKTKGLIIPEIIFYLSIILNVVCGVVYFIIYFFDVSKLWPKFTLLHKLDDAFELIKNKNKVQIIKCLLISLLSEITWILQIWFVGRQFGINLSLLAVFVFIPIISLILVLPISVGGFGAREQLYLFFFSQFGSNESILLMSTFLGILGIINALFGGILLLFDVEMRKKLKNNNN